MRLRPAQLALFWRLWAEACAVQGWQGAEREIQRKAVLAELGFSSLKLVDHTAGFDRLKGRLQTLAYRIQGGTEAAFPDVGEMRRHCGIIRTDLLPRLAAVHPDPQGYLARILRDRFGGEVRWESLAENPETGPRLVRHLLFTLTRAVRRLEREAERAADRAALDKPLKTSGPGPQFGQNEGSPPAAPDQVCNPAGIREL